MSYSVAGPFLIWIKSTAWRACDNAIRLKRSSSREGSYVGGIKARTLHTRRPRLASDRRPSALPTDARAPGHRSAAGMERVRRDDLPCPTDVLELRRPRDLPLLAGREPSARHVPPVLPERGYLRGLSDHPRSACVAAETR